MSNEDIASLKQVLDTTFTNFNKYSKVYPFTNEYLKKYYKNLDGLDVLTVLGSGDQFFNAAMSNPKSIDVFDINMYAFYYYKLKRAFIENLTFSEYVDNGYGNKEIYKKVRDTLKDETKDFFDYIFNEVIKDNEPLINCNLFNGLLEENAKNLKFFNNYFSEKGFEYLKAHLNEIDSNMYLSHLFGLTTINKKYDRIYLSNISQYITKVRKYTEVIKELYNNNLKENGIIYLSYVYGHSYWPDLPSTGDFKIKSKSLYGKKRVDKIYYTKKNQY